MVISQRVRNPKKLHHIENPVMERNTKNLKRERGREEERRGRRGGGNKTERDSAREYAHWQGVRSALWRLSSLGSIEHTLTPPRLAFKNN